MSKDLKKMKADLAALKKSGLAKTSEFNSLSAQDAPDPSALSTLEADLTALEGQVETLSAEIAAQEATIRRSGMFGSKAPPRSAAFTYTAQEPRQDPAQGFRNLADFAVAVRGAITGGTFDERLLASATPPGTQNIVAGGSGEGFMVPPDFSKDIWELVFSGNDLLNFITPEPTASNAVGLPKDETTPWGAAGVHAYWRGKGQALKASQLNTSGVMVQLHPLDAYVVADDELLQDAPRLNDRLMRRASMAIRWTASDSIAWGDGVGQPLGFMAASYGGRVVVAKESGQAAATINVANLSKMLTRIRDDGGSPIFIGTREIIPQLVQLQIGNYPVFIPETRGIQGAPNFATLLGYPLFFTNHNEGLGTEGDLVLMNADGYYAVTKQGGGVDFASSIHLFFDYAKTAFRWTFRFGGQPILSAPVPPARGTATTSHFVTLATRA